MDVGTITSLISTVGFPIFCCIVLGWYTYTTNKENNARIDALNDKITDALNNNTQALERLSAMLDKRDEKGE